MKRGNRVEEIQTFHNTAARGGGTTAAIHQRIQTPPQHNNNSPSLNTNQFHILNVSKDTTGGGSIMVAPSQSIQYTYTPTAITNATNQLQKNNVTQQQQQQQQQPAPPPSSGQVHVVNATSVNLTNSRPKPAAAVVQQQQQSGGVVITQTSHQQQQQVVTSPGAAAPVITTSSAQSVSGQNFPRLKVEDALSYLDQVCSE